MLRSIYVLFVGCLLAAFANACAGFLLPHDQFAASSTDQAPADLAIAIVYMMIGLIVHPRFEELADGLVVGGMFTAVTAVVVSVWVPTSGLSFLIPGAALVAAILLGYFKFFRHRSAS